MTDTSQTSNQNQVQHYVNQIFITTGVKVAPDDPLIALLASKDNDFKILKKSIDELSVQNKDLTDVLLKIVEANNNQVEITEKLLEALQDNPNQIQAVDDEAENSPTWREVRILFALWGSLIFIMVGILVLVL